MKYLSSRIASVLLLLSSAKGQTCLQCLQVNTQCISDCGIYAGPDFTLFELSNCHLQCTHQLQACCNAYGGGGTSSGTNNGGGGGSVLPSIGEVSDSAAATDGQIAAANALLGICEDTLEDATADDPIVSLEEFKNHVSLFQNAICPSVSIGQDYFDVSYLPSFYAELSCGLCAGIYDPLNPNAQNDSYENCGCFILETDPSSVPPINKDIMTGNEATAYCSNAYHMVYTQCQQPQPECLNSCRITQSNCFASCTENAVSVDVFIQCYNQCSPPFFPCVDACESNGGSPPGTFQAGLPVQVKGATSAAANYQVLSTIMVVVLGVSSSIILVLM